MHLEATHRAGVVPGPDDALHRTDTAARDPALRPGLPDPDLAPTAHLRQMTGRGNA